jgi:hypothetical protein
MRQWGQKEKGREEKRKNERETEYVLITFII